MTERERITANDGGPEATERIYETDRLTLRIADYRTALAQSQAKLAEALYEIEKLTIARRYKLGEGESVSIDTGIITRGHG